MESMNWIFENVNLEKKIEDKQAEESSKEQ